MIYDYAIIGCGFAGLYAAYVLEKRGYHTIAFEASKNLGGRAIEKEINNYKVKIGGGIVDFDNLELIKLVQSFGIKLNKMKQRIIDDYMNYDYDINESINLIKEKYFEINQCLNMTVDEFLDHYFGLEFKNMYYKFSEFNDFKDQDINDYILRYKIEDNLRGEYECYSFSYSELADKMKRNIIYEKIISIEKNNGQIILNKNYKTKNVINCMTISEANKLYNYSFLNEIGSVPFCRIYTYHKEKLNIPNGIIILDNECKKMIKMNDFLVMSVYCDSENALYWKDKIENDEILETLKSKLNFLPPIEEYLLSYWFDGIHYFKPNIKNQDALNMRKYWLLDNMNPEPGIYFAGEYFSEKGGYVEGAISSVNFLMDNFIFIKSVK